jgi:PAS domain S-box-containing protein
MNWLIAGDTLVHFAVRALGTPMALFARVDDGYVEIVSHAGLDDGAPRRAAARDDELTAPEGVVLLPDFGADPRFAGGLWAQIAPGARAAAVVAVNDEEGRRVGVLAVLDTKPRAWTAADASLLTRFAGGVPVLTSGVERRTEELRLANLRLTQEVDERRRAEARYQAVVRNFPDGGVAMFDHDLRYTLTGGLRLEPAGLAGKEGQTIWEALSPETAARIEPALRDVLRGSSSVIELPHEGRTYLIHGMPVRGEDGEITAGILVAQETSPRLAAERALFESEERYRVLFEKAGTAIYIIAAEGAEAGAIVEANTTCAAMHGHGVAELCAMKAVELLAPPPLAGTLDDLRRALAGEWVEGEDVHVRKDGTRFPVEYSAGPLGTPGKRSVVVFVRDVTERKQADEVRRRAGLAAEAANQAKSQFLTTMSHEIRTPMNAILGHAQLLMRDAGLGPAQRQHVEIIHRSGDHLLDLVNDVLEMSKIEAGHLKLSSGDVDLVALVDDVARMFRLRAEAELLSFTIERAPEVPRHIVGDAGKLRQVLVNLLGNAMKFTREGGIILRLRAPPAPAGPTLVVEIEDTGPGISPAELAELFKPFSQARAGIQARGGTGLGLALCREFAHVMGGDVTVESRVGHGSVFRLAIPLQRGAGPATELPAPRSGPVVGIVARGSPPRVLVVEDEEDGRSWLRQLLQQVGFEVLEAVNGIEAVARVEQWRPHLVLMDIHLPLMDGYAAMRAIRALPAGQGTVIIALTALAFDEGRDAIFAAGADGWLRKPCREEELFAEIGRHLGVEYRHAAARASSSSWFAAVGRPDSTEPLLHDLRARLREAAHLADYERLTALIGEMPLDHAHLGRTLERLAERFAYDEIEVLLREPMPGPPA